MTVVLAPFSTLSRLPKTLPKGTRARSRPSLWPPEQSLIVQAVADLGAWRNGVRHLYSASLLRVSNGPLEPAEGDVRSIVTERPDVRAVHGKAPLGT